MYDIENIVEESLKSYLAGLFDTAIAEYPIDPENEDTNYLKGALSAEALGFDCKIDTAYNLENEEQYPCAIIEVVDCENEIATKNLYNLDVEIEIITSTLKDKDKTEYRKILSALRGAFLSKDPRPAEVITTNTANLNIDICYLDNSDKFEIDKDEQRQSKILNLIVKGSIIDPEI